MKILFMGTPDFAAIHLRALCDYAAECGDEIVGAITQEDKPRGRGYKLTPPPVKVAAMERGIPVYQPATLKDESFAELLSALAPDLIAVVAYGKILPKNVLDFPRYGCVNVHGSLLPEYRGAAPMQRAIIDGKKLTGITTMLMDVGLDTGDMLLRAELPIENDDNFESVHDKMASLGAELLKKTVDALKNGTVTPTPQPDGATYAAKIEKTDCVIDFDLDANTIYNRVRGLSPFPLAFTHLPDGNMLKVVAARVDADGESAEVGTVVALDGAITVACGKDGRERLSLLQILPAGKGRMNAADFIRGRKIALGDKLL
jgi:methionyl-tRNA formyltransferase